MNALCTVRGLSKNEEKKSSRLLSGGDEKVLRLFEAPYNFIKTMNRLNPHLVASAGQEGTSARSDQQLVFSLEHSNEQVEQMIESDAKKQPLGLMNKPAVLLANKGMRVDE